jgi:uncharacterized integral membrane protein (TIGR00698 family)
VARPQWLPRSGDLPGALLAFAAGGVALAAARALPPSPFVSEILFALVAGALVANTPLRRAIGLERPGLEREPDRYAGGLRWVAKWLLRLAIVLMGLEVQTRIFGGAELALIAATLAVALPATFFVAQAVGAWLELRRPMADLITGGTLICGASAIAALAPVVKARREEQGVATAAVFLFSVVALLAFRPIAAAVGLDPVHAGIWSGVAVNDLSSAIAVGSSMGGDGGTFAAAAKSARVLLLAPLLLLFALVRPGHAAARPAGASEHVPRYLLGYIALALARAAGDRLFAGEPAWAALLAADALAIDVILLAVAAAIGLHLDVRHVLGSGARALLTGGAASLVMAGLTLAIITAAARGAASAAALVGILGLGAAVLLWWLATRAHSAQRVIEKRFRAGLPLSLAEATQLLDAREAAGELDDETRRRVLAQLHPTIGELIPARERPLAHGDGTRWLTYWEGRSGWSLVAVCREPGSLTPIHAHPHALLAKTIEGAVEELRFREDGEAAVLVERHLLAHGELVETAGLATMHAIRALGPRAGIDLQLRGPEQGSPGRRLRAVDEVDLAALPVGARVRVAPEVDDRPGHGGEGAAAGRVV